MRKFAAALILSIVFVCGLSVTLASPKAKAAAGVNCDNNAVVYCGAASAGGLMNKYASGDGVNSAASIQHVYSAFGINASDVQSMGSTARLGSVTRSGDVYVGDQLVATNALTAGRQNIAGSTRHMNQGTVFFTRPPSVSFASSPLSAFVVMKNGVFQFAILTSCGNPVMAHPKSPPPQQQPPKQQPPAPAKPVTQKPAKPAPAKICNGNTTNSDTGGVAAQGGNCSVNTTNNTVNTTTNTNNTVTQTQTAAPTSSESPPASETQEATSSAPNSEIAASQTTPAPAAETTTPTTTESSSSQPAATTLPNTGEGNLLGIFGVTTILGTLGYRFFLSRYLRHNS